MSSKSVVFKMKCRVTSDTSHEVLLSKEIIYKSYKEICIGEPKKVNFGYWGNVHLFKVENNSLVHILKELVDYQHGERTHMALDWEVLSKFFSTHNIEPNWLDCNYTTGWYDEELEEWNGCMGKVWETEY